ncbi:MAG: sugar phosphate isomerase/epimerase [Armatimonadetes bacterium]|nr:sugar phosphate isomerase/epimerase [Armatimonadota bacterium]
MKIGVLTVLYSEMPFEKMLDHVAEMGCEAVEIGCGGYPGDAHCDPGALLKDEAAQRKFLRAIEGRGLSISALSCHGNPVHPIPSRARKFHEAWRKTVRLAEALGVERVVGFSGCPGDSDDSKYPNWVTCPWPPDFSEVLEWQWKEKLVPYWTKEVAYAAKHGIEKICFEMHPGFCVYNPETLLKLRAACGNAIGANFDPSHLFWQGIDPVVAIRELGPAIYHFHAKDVKIDPSNTVRNGVLDTKTYTHEVARSWIFRTVGYGHGAEVWKAMISELRLAGYDHVLSIEHEDSLMSIDEGLGKAIAFLKEAVISEPPPKVWWA